MKYQEQITKNKLREARQALGLRQRDISKLLGLAITDRISHWEKGRAVPSIINLFRLCKIYKTTPQDLYSELHQAINQDSPN